MWHENGQKSEERNYKDGDLVNETIFSYWDNGQMFSQATYRDDKADGKLIFWNKERSEG